MFCVGSPKLQRDDVRSLRHWTGGGRLLSIRLVPHGFLVQTNGDAVEDRIVLFGWTVV